MIIWARSGVNGGVAWPSVGWDVIVIHIAAIHTIFHQGIKATFGKMMLITV